MGRPRKRKPQPPRQQPTDHDVLRFTQQGAGPGGKNIFGFHCRDCDHYETMIGGVQQKNSIDYKALTHECGVERDSWKDRKDLN